MVDPDELSKYDNMTPTALDYRADYGDALQRMGFHVDVPAGGDGGLATIPTIHYPGDTDARATLSKPYGIRPISYHSFAQAMS